MENNKDLLKKQITDGLIFMILLVFIVLVLFSMSKGYLYEKPILSQSSVTEINDFWNTKENGKEYVFNFCKKFETKKDEKIVLKRSLDGIKISDEDKICIITSFADFRVYMDETLIYSFCDEDFYEYKNIAREKIHFINIPPNLEKKEIKLELIKSADSKIDYSIDSCRIGTEVAIKNSILSQDLMIILVNFIIIGIGLIILGFAIFAWKKKITQMNDLFLISAFLILIAIYSLSESFSIQLLTNNILLCNTLAYTSLLMVLVPIFSIISKNVIEKYKIYINVANYILLTNVTIQSILTCLNIIDFRRMIVFTDCLIVSILVIIIYICIKSAKNRKKKDKLLFLRILPILFGTLIDIILYLKGISNVHAIYFQLGLLFYAGFEFYSVAVKFIAFYKQSINIQMFKKLAFTDTMTGINNRAAFEKSINEINNNLTKYEYIWCISFDLNNLKIINDTKGHMLGDRLIIKLAEALKYTFDASNLFRIGGDEFFVIIFNISKKELEGMIGEFKMILEKINMSEENKVNVAIGYEKLDCNIEKNIFETIKQADYAMYKDKKKIKEVLKCF